MTCSNVVVAGTRYFKHLFTNRLIRYHAALRWRYALSIFRAGLPKQISQYNNCRDFKIYGRKRTQKCVRSLFRWIWMGTMIWHFWQQFGSKLPYIWQWSSKISWQRRYEQRQWRHSSMTSIFIDVQLRRSAEHINAQFWRLGEILPLECGRLSCVP